MPSRKRATPVGGGLHQRAVERRAHVQAPGAGAALRGEADQPVDGPGVSGDHDLPGAVQVRGRDHLAVRGRLAQRRARRRRRDPITAAIAPAPDGNRLPASAGRARARHAGRRRTPARRPRPAPTTRRGCDPPATRGASPAVSASTRHTATLVASIAGCACSVRASSSAGPSKQSAESAMPRHSSASSKVRRAGSNAAARSRPMPTRWEPCPGNRQATAAGSVSLP